MTTIIKGDFSKRQKNSPNHGSEEKPAPIYQLKVSLAFSDPVIWRRLQIPGNISLAQLHHIIQKCMGWNDIHSHRFLVGKVFYAPSDGGEPWEKTGERDEAAFQLVDLENDMKWCFTYIYDFGDGWEHEIELEECISGGQADGVPVLVDGEQACPPENVGGIPGYEEFLTIINNPQHEQHGKMAKWYGSDHFDPHHFDESEINRVLKKSSPLTLKTR